MFNNFINLKYFVLSVLLYISTANSKGTEISLPLSRQDWTILSYNKITPNKVTISDNQLRVQVKASAGPLVHQLKTPAKMNRFYIKGSVVGEKRVETGPFDEDSILRFGLVATGNRTLSGPKKWLAADWVKKLFSLAPEGFGIDKIYFFNITNRPEILGKSRIHPLSELMVEQIFLVKQKGGDFELTKELDPPIETAALWISIDGDNSQSEYETFISQIRLNLVP